MLTSYCKQLAIRSISMKKIVIFMIALVFVFSFASCKNETSGTDTQENGKITVAVGIVPEAAFVEKIAGDLVDVVTLIPPGNSPANYQPTAVEMQELSDAAIYFSMQTPTEEANILPKVADFNSGMEVIMLRDIVSEQYSLRYMDAHDHEEEDEDHEDEEHADEEHDDHLDEDHETEDEGTVDPHIWLSPKRVIVMVETIADKLTELDSENAEVYSENAEEYIAELQALDQEISQNVGGMVNKTFLIYHGSYGYFSDDYELTMISLESAGKPVTAAKMQEVIDFAKQEGIKTVFYQVEFSDVQANTVAEEIGGNVTKAQPLSADYIQGLKDFANALVNQGE